MDQAQPANLQRCLNIPSSSEQFPGLGPTACHAFTRSDHTCGEAGTREQLNGITAFIDGSQVRMLCITAFF